MKKTIGLIILLFIFSSASFLGFRYFEIKDIRNKLENVSITKSYKEEFNKSIDNILKEGEIKNEHKKWISEFLENELNNKEEFRTTEVYLKMKLLKKNINFSEKAAVNFTMELMKLKSLEFQREELVNKIILEYKAKQEKPLSSFIENNLFDGEIDTSKINYK